MDESQIAAAHRHLYIVQARRESRMLNQTTIGSPQSPTKATRKLHELRLHSRYIRSRSERNTTRGACVLVAISPFGCTAAGTISSERLRRTRCSFWYRTGLILIQPNRNSLGWICTCPKLFALIPIGCATVFLRQRRMSGLRDVLFEDYG